LDIKIDDCEVIWYDG